MGKMAFLEKLAAKGISKLKPIAKQALNNQVNKLKAKTK